MEEKNDSVEEYNKEKNLYLLLADSVVKELVREGYVEEETVMDIAERQYELSKAHAEDFRKQMGLDELDFDKRKEFDKSIHFDEEFLSKLASIRMEEFDSAPVIDHKEVLERAVDIAYEEVVNDE